MFRNNSEQNFSISYFKVLLGHTRSITCVALSHNGKLLASGQEIPRGHKAEIIIWEYDNRMQLIRLPFHDGKVNYVADTIVYFTVALLFFLVNI